ncbi:MAG: hypothetical protein WCF19_02595 [Chlamydiales bacterium]
MSIGLLTAACSAPCSWQIDSIQTGNGAFDSSRLQYASTQAHCPMLFEMIKIGSRVEAFISLTHLRFTSDAQMKIVFTIDDQPLEDVVPVNEGAMRIRLLPQTTERIIQSLQEGKKIVILVDGFKETLDPDQFSSSFAKFMREGNFFENFFKGPT